MELKNYQKNTIEILKNYLMESKRVGSKYAFMGITENPYNSDFFSEIPFICIKIPTGGGKTLVGCYMVDEIMGSILNYKMDRGIVMWFVPSEAIKTQTLKKFKDRNDWHRKALDEAFENDIRIFSNEEALSIRNEDIEENLCIIVSSLDAFRKEKKLQKKYKVYQENGALLNHFENIEENDSLEKDENNTIINSLANVVRINRPLFIIDEGHKTKTKLSIDFLKDLNPSFIVEFTATPRLGSNILVDIPPRDLKDEEMVKIPIVLESSTQWQNSIMRGIEKRNELEKEFKKIKEEYVRPIVLLQAQPKSKISENITVKKVKDFLIDSNISEEEIACKTSEINEIEGVNLFSKKCKIRYIITVSALAEGWDCSFAYVLVSVANLGAKIAVEQIIGRVIRMPGAKRKENEDLNRCYIFASAKNFQEAASQIISGLENNGYSKFDLLNVTQKSDKYEYYSERVFKEDLAIPILSFKGERLSFEDLIGEDFELSKQNYKFDFKAHYDNDGRAIIDIKENGGWQKGSQQFLKLTYKDKNFSKEELMQWIDKKLRYKMIDKLDKVRYIEKVLKILLKEETLLSLSVNRYVLINKLNEEIKKILEDYAKKRFDYFINKGIITVKPFERFPGSITISTGIPQKFNRNYYEKVDKLNKEELRLIERLDIDSLPNVRFWVRNREKRDPFYIQGWRKNKFFPDFVVATERGNILALEWKGEDRISNEDTDYKTCIGKIWAKLGREKLHFFLVHNKNVEEVLCNLKEL